MTQPIRTTIAALFIASVLVVQAKDEVKAAEPALKTEKEKLSYAIGMEIGTSLNQIAGEVDAEILTMALKETLAGKSRMTREEAGAVQQAFFMKKQAEAMKEANDPEVANKNLAEGKAFLAKNGKAEGVKTTKSGLQYKVLTKGNGDMPKASDAVTVHYHGTFIDGEVFDSSVERKEPVTFPLNGVIKGWTEGLQLMNVGSKYRFFIPADLAYGAGGRPGMPPNSVLLFDVELLSIGAPQGGMPH